MTTRKAKETPSESTIEIIQSHNHQSVYADRIVNFAMGASVTKLNFSNEIAPNKNSVHLTVTIPTFALIEAIDFLAKTIDVESEFSTDILSKLEQYKKRLEKK